jgi:hypothetical protein
MKESNTEENTENDEENMFRRNESGSKITEYIS